MDVQVTKNETVPYDWFANYGMLSGISDAAVNSFMRLTDGGGGVFQEMARMYERGMRNAQDALQDLVAAKSPGELFNSQISYLSNSACQYFNDANTLLAVAVAGKAGANQPEQDVKSPAAPLRRSRAG